MALVLVVDDDPDILSLVAGALHRVGHTVRAAADGPSALEAARREVPDAIVRDVMLPGMTGLQVCRALRADLTTAAIPVLMLTALGGEHDIEGAFRVGTDDYLTKPFHLDELTGRVADLLATEPAAGAVDAPRGSVEYEGPSRIALDHLTSRPAILLLRALVDGARTATELHTANPHEPDLGATLRVLVRDGWARRSGEAYELTEAGSQLARRLHEVLTLIERTVPATILAQHRYQRTV
jgi:DNA-binding response OmpR family regulator